MYTLREKLAYSIPGKLLATIIRNALYPNARVHWIQQCFADLSFKAVK